MKKLIFLILPLVLLAGCVHSGMVAPLPAGAVDQTDATANQTLQTIHAFLAKVSADVQSGAIAPSATQRAALDTANKALNTASLAEQAYHSSGGGSASVLTAALTAAESAFSTVQTSLVASATAK